MNRQRTLEQVRQQSLASWATAQRHALQEAVRNTPVNQAPASAAGASGTGSGGTGVASGLKLVFDNISNASLVVGDAESVEGWNTFFNLPAAGVPFTSVSVIGNSVYLIGGADITLKSFLFYDPNVFPTPPANTSLLQVDDETGCVVALDEGAFLNCTALTSVSFPAALTIGPVSANYGVFDTCTSLSTINLPSATFIGYGAFAGCAITGVSLPSAVTVAEQAFVLCASLTSANLPAATELGTYCFNMCASLTSANLPAATNISNYCFADCTSLTSIQLPACTNLGATTGNYDGVFSNITGNTISLTVPAALMTSDGGNPDADIVDLQNNNTVTVTTV